MSELVSAAPPSGGIDWSSHKGSLLLIEPISFETGIKTSYGDADAVKANVHVITGEGGQSEDYAECLIFPKLLASQLKGQVGRKVVGRLSQGVAKPGQSAPWLLDEATADDIAKAQEWIAAQQTSSVASAKPPF